MAIGKFSIQKLIHYIKKFGGGKITTQDEGANIDTNVTKLNFVGASVEVADAGSGVSTITIDADAGYNHWVLEDGDGTEVNITNQKEVKLVDGNGLHINWHPDGDGSDSTPYLMEFTASYENINDLTTVTIANGDYLIVQDVNDSNNPKKGLVSDIATDAAGSDTQIQYNNGGAAFGGIADLTWDDTDVKIGGSSGTTKLLFRDSALFINSSADGTLDVEADSTINVGTDNSGVAINIGHATSEVTVGDNLTVTGDLTVNGTTTTVNSTTVEIKDKNIELGVVTSASDVTADGGGITLSGSTNKTFNWVNSTDAWTSSEHIETADGKYIKTDKVRARDGDGLYLVDDGDNGIFIKDGGNVGIGVIDPDAKIEIFGTSTQFKISYDATNYDFRSRL